MPILNRYNLMEENRKCNNRGAYKMWKIIGSAEAPNTFIEIFNVSK